MKKFLLLLIITLLWVICAQGQTATTTQNARRLPNGSGAPTGACVAGPPFVQTYVDTSTTPPTTYYCKAGTWTASSGAGASAPKDATYITQTANSTLTNEQAMGLLGTGIVKNTTTTGVQSIITPGTGVETALAVNVGTAGAFVVNGGALGTPSSGTGTNITGIPAANISSGALANGMTATTQSQADNSTKLATTAYADTLGATKLNLSGGTLTGNLLFTDATYDIGASAATRPRDFFLSRNATVGGLTTTAGIVSTAGYKDTGTTIFRSENTFAARPAGSTGVGLEIGISGAGTISFIQSYNATTPAIAPMQLSASMVAIPSSGLHVGGTTDAGNDNLLVDAVTTSATYATVTNCSDSAGAAACGSAAAGSVVIDASATSVVVSTTAVTANSQIFVQNDSSLGTRLGVTCNTQSSLTLGAPRVTARTAATSFTITIEVGPTTNPMCLSYHIVN